MLIGWLVCDSDGGMAGLLLLVVEVRSSVSLAVPSPGVDCRPANGSLSAGNIRQIFGGIFEIPCAEWYTSVDRRLLN